MIAVWNQIKRLRKEQAFIATTVKMTVRRNNTDLAMDNLRLQRELEFEVALLVQEHEDEKAQVEAEYDEELRKYTQYRHSMRSPSAKRVRLTAPEDEADEGSKQTPPEENVEAATQGAETEGRERRAPVPKPTKPSFPPLNVEAERNKILDRLMKIRRKPGEPELIPMVSRQSVPTPTDECPSKEQSRRKRIAGYKAYVRLLVHGNVVTRTKAVPLDWGFTATFNELCRMHVTHHPDTLALEICHVGVVADDIIATTYADVPAPEMGNMGPPKKQMELVEFSSEERVSVGNDVDTEVDRARFMHGITYLHIGWASPEGREDTIDVEKGTRSLLPLGTKERRPSFRINLALSPSTTKIRSRDLGDDRLGDLDPNDPRNAPLLMALRSATASGKRASAYFRVSYVDRDLFFLAGEDSAPARRQLLLRYRSQAGIEKAIPLLEKDVDEGLYRMTPSGDVEEVTEDAAAPDRRGHSDGVSDQQLIRKRQRNLVYAKGKRAQQKPQLGDIVKEMQLPEFKLSLDFLMELFVPRRKLRPTRRTRKAITTRPDRCNLVIQVIRAYNLPVRVAPPSGASTLPLQAPRPGAPRVDPVSLSMGRWPAGGPAMAPLQQDTTPLMGSSAGRDDDDDVPTSGAERLVPFVEVRFQGKVQRTRRMEGPNPQWNENVTIPFSPPNNDWSFQTLEAVQDSVSINLFDEMTFNNARDDRERNTIYQRIEQRWVGSLSIPFSTIYQNGVVEGAFVLDVPVLNLGYQTEAPTIPAETSSLSPAHTMLSLFITLDPPLVTQPPVIDELDSKEDKALLFYGNQWIETIKKMKQCAQRDVQFTCANLDGQAVLVCRYVRPQAPPLELDTPLKAARFVSLIPFEDDWIFFKQRYDVWNTSREFLALGTGDWEEHAILLCNFFLFFQMQAYIVAGRGIPEGRTYYVMVRESDGRTTKVTFWNASTGRSFKSTDIHSSLREIDYVFNATNVWANTQETSDPSSMNFMLENEKLWRPFFNKQFLPQQYTQESVQDETLQFIRPPPKEKSDLELKIEEVLVRKFESWRIPVKTRWNRVCSRILKTLLPKFEDEKVGGPPVTEEEQNSELSRVLTTYTLSGFPLNITWTNLDSVATLLQNTCLHETGLSFHAGPQEHMMDSAVEFALAVYVRTYPCSISSVWVYAVALSPV